jgi:hypothetical protein
MLKWSRKLVKERGTNIISCKEQYKTNQEDDILVCGGAVNNDIGGT